MLKFIRILCIGIGLAALAGGCATTPTHEITPLTDTQLRGVFSKARDARSFWITAYPAGKNSVRFSGANRLHPEHVASRDFAKEGLSTAPVIVADNGREETFSVLVDTTAGRSWLDFPTFLRTRAIPLGPPAYDYTPANVNEDISGYACIMTKLRFDQLHVENALFHFRAATGPLGPLARGLEDPVPEAILGCDILKAFAFTQIDYPSHTVMLSATIDYAPEEANLIAAMKLKQVDGAFAVEGAIDGEKKVFILDSAGEFEVAMTNPPSDELKQVSVGDVVFRNVSAVDGRTLNLRPSHPHIGRQLLSKFKITLAPKKKLVYFERPAGAK